MGRSPLWTAIREQIAADIARGHYGPGDRLPTEAQLSERFGVNRHTLRRALADLAASGMVHARRGAGVFVRNRPTAYPLGRRVRFHQNLMAAGRVPDRRILLLETRSADTREAAALALAPGAAVHVFEGLSLAYGAPIALFHSVFPAARFPGLMEHLPANPSVTAALAAEGLPDYTRASTEITAKTATPHPCRTAATPTRCSRFANGGDQYRWRGPAHRIWPHMVRRLTRGADAWGW